MKLIQATVVIVLMISTLLVIIDAKKGNGKRGKGNKNETIASECLGQSLNLQKMNLGFDECLEETAPLEIPSGLSDDEKISVIKGRKRALKKKQMCVKLCQRKKQGILDSSGSFSAEGTKSFMNEVFPTKAVNRLQRALTRCVPEDGEHYDMTDNCKEYRRFEKCLMRMVAKSCGWRNGKNRAQGGRNGKGRRGNKGRKHDNESNGPGRQVEHESEEIHEEDEDEI